MQSRKPTRLAGYDYSGRGAYFVTICVQDRRCILSAIVGADDLGGPLVRLSPYGEIVDHNLQIMREIYPDIQIDKYVIMPNHVHLLLTLCGRDGAPRSSPPTNTLPNFVAALKKFTNKAYGENIWQRSFHDHIIRNEDDYRTRWQYIDENPAKWAAGKDEYYV